MSWWVSWGYWFKSLPKQNTTSISPLSPSSSYKVLLLRQDGSFQFCRQCTIQGAIWIWMYYSSYIINPYYPHTGSTCSLVQLWGLILAICDCTKFDHMDTKCVCRQTNYEYTSAWCAGKYLSNMQDTFDVLKGRSRLLQPFFLSFCSQFMSYSTNNCTVNLSNWMWHGMTIAMCMKLQCNHLGAILIHCMCYQIPNPSNAHTAWVLQKVAR